jgi:two-component system, cell cycle response regulator
MESSGPRVILIQPDAARAEIVGRRLRAQGYAVEHVPEAATGADLALRAPPRAVVADLWTPGISGVQLCRLLRCEAATSGVPVVLCGDHDEPRDRFWAERAGAFAFVVKGRTGDLVRALARAMRDAPPSDSFFTQLAGGSVDIRDRLARHLDTALFESVIAAEIRVLGCAASFDRLFDRLAQFMSEVCRYRWLALSTPAPARTAVHHHPDLAGVAVAEARAALGASVEVAASTIEDEDALALPQGPPPLSCDVLFGSSVVARLACGPSGERLDDMRTLFAIVQRELGGAVKIATLIEESQRLAAVDALTGLMNRRAFGTAMDRELSRCERHGYALSMLLLDVDHFKAINDQRGHACGDRVLSALGQLVQGRLRLSDVAARWGGEEFVVACTSTDEAGTLLAAERLREAIERMTVLDDRGERIAVTASIGVAEWRVGESLEEVVDRADRAMYAAKVGGRNRVCGGDVERPVTGSRPVLAAVGE